MASVCAVPLEKANDSMMLRYFFSNTTLTIGIVVGFIFRSKAYPDAFAQVRRMYTSNRISC
jgi:hypothetical protein